MPEQLPIPSPIDLDVQVLRDAIQNEYAAVAEDPTGDFYFHTGRTLTRIVGYRSEWLDGIPETAVASFAGTGNPFSLGSLQGGERVVDVGCEAGIDSLIAAQMVGEDGRVIGIDMTLAMLDRTRRAADEMGATTVEFREGFMEALPVPDGWADVVISNEGAQPHPGQDQGARRNGAGPQTDRSPADRRYHNRSTGAGSREARD